MPPADRNTSAPKLFTHAAHHLPQELAAVALIDGSTAAATGRMSLSWWLEEVRLGRAPQPVIRQPRCTRWTVRSVAAFWAERAAASADGAAVIDKARTASRAARAPDARAKAKATRAANSAARAAEGQRTDTGGQ